jgi:hypothetical protein
VGLRAEGPSSGRAECDDVRRTVGGARALGEGVAIDAEVEVPDECTVGNLGAEHHISVSLVQ